VFVRKTAPAQAARCASVLWIGYLGGCGAALLYESGDSSTDPSNPSTLNLEASPTFVESDANDLLELAESVDVTGEPQVISGRISDSADVDVFDFGPVLPGDRIVVNVATDDNLNGAIALFDQDGNSLLVNDHRNVYLGQLGPFIDVVIRRPSGACYVVMTATPGFSAHGDYLLEASKEAAVEIPVPRPDVFVLDFVGGSNVRIGNRPPIDVPPFNAADISAQFEGDTREMMEHVVKLVRDDFKAFNITILSTHEDGDAPEDASRVYFGTLDEALLGVAEGVDEYNATKGQPAIVFTNTFSAFMPLRPSVEDMAQAVANVASHEIGHLLGLVHTDNPAELMDVTASLRELMDDQDFATSPLYGAVFPIGFQDSVQYLLDALGGDAIAAKALRSYADLKSRLPLGAYRKPPARGSLTLSRCGLNDHGHH